MNTLPAGLTDQNIEFFVDNDKVKALYDGSVKSYVELPNEVKEIVLVDMLKNKAASNKLQTLGFTGNALIEKYIKCRFGNFDNIPDIDIKARKLNSEYVNCPDRDKCDGCGIVCMLPSSLSSKQIDIINSLKDGQPVKSACEKVNLNYHTYRAALKNIYRKMNVHSNVELINVARQYNLI